MKTLNAKNLATIGTDDQHSAIVALAQTLAPHFAVDSVRAVIAHVLDVPMVRVTKMATAGEIEADTLMDLMREAIDAIPTIPDVQDLNVRDAVTLIADVTANPVLVGIHNQESTGKARKAVLGAIDLRLTVLADEARIAAEEKAANTDLDAGSAVDQDVTAEKDRPSGEDVTPSPGPAPAPPSPEPAPDAPTEAAAPVSEAAPVEPASVPAPTVPPVPPAPTQAEMIDALWASFEAHDKDAFVAAMTSLLGLRSARPAAARMARAPKATATPTTPKVASGKAKSEVVDLLRATGPGTIEGDALLRLPRTSLMNYTYWTSGPGAVAAQAAGLTARLCKGSTGDHNPAMPLDQNGKWATALILSAAPETN